jgi:type II secretory pathway pseudopilin PulG
MGFSLLEILLVMAIVVLIAGIGVGFYVNYGRSVEVNSAAQTLIFDLKQAQSKSMGGVDGLKWGIHFVNEASSSDYYEIFSTETDYANGTVVSKNYLSGGIAFSVPTEGNSTSIIFNKISGGTTETSIAIFSGGATKTINVSAIGNISSQ